jgi:8-oxo-dGTP pyrophosphatase MutT (NUDIX family)
MTRTWQVLKSTVLVDRRPWIYLSEQDVVLPNGTRIDGYITWEEREYALVVALTKDGVPLVHQYKHGVKSVNLDLPGGYLNANETPLVAVQRELLEETGLAAGNWFHLGSLVLDNNRGHAQTHLFLARDARVIGPPCPDETEDLVISFYSLLQLREMVYKGQITSLPSVAALLLAMQQLDARG